MRSLAAAIRKVAAWMGLLLVLMAGSVQAQTYGPEQSICWGNWGNFDRIRVRFEATGVNSDYDSNITVNGNTIASVGRNPWGGNSYSGETYVYKPININLSWYPVGGSNIFVPYNPRIDYSCNPTFEDTGYAPIEGTFYFYGSYLVKSNISVSKSASPYNLKSGATGQSYTIAVSISTTTTTAPTYIYDTLPTGITTSGAITASGGQVYGCPAAGASNLNGCYIPAGSSGTVYIHVPVNVANNLPSSVTNTAYAYNTGSANCTSTTSCPGSSTNPVTPASATLFITQSVSSNVTTPGSWNFPYVGSNGVGSPTLTSTTPNAAAVNSSNYTLTTVGQATTVQLSAPGGWYITNAYCQDNNAAVSGNPTGPISTGAGNTWGAYTVTIPAANVRAGAAFQCFASYSQSSFRLIKALKGPRISDSDQFTVQLFAGGTLEISSLTAGQGSTITSGDTGAKTVNWGSHTIQEAAAGTTNLGNYAATVSCVNAATAGTVVSGITKLGDSVSTKDGDNITCTITNTPRPVFVLQQSVGTAVTSTGPWNFGYDSGTNGLSSQFTVTNTRTGVYVPSTPPQLFSTLGVDATLHANIPAGWFTYAISCVDTNGVNSGNGTGNLGSYSSVGRPGQSNILTIPAANVRMGAVIVCSFSYGQSSITVSKQMGGTRISDTDQFTVQLRNTATGALDGSGTTQGNGSSIVQGTTGAVVVDWGSTHAIEEVISSGSSKLPQYSSSVACVNAASAGTNVSGVSKLGDTITTKDGDAITCTITNTPKLSSLSLSKALAGTGRVNTNDQFTMQIKTGGLTGTPVASTTTTGSGTSVLTGTASLNPTVAGTEYTLVEGSSGGTNLGQYSSSITCVDSAGFQSGLPNNLTYSTLVGYKLTPVAGAQIACTITNTPQPSSLSLSKALAGAGRANPNDQFTMQIKTGGIGGTPVASATTTGSGTSVLTGTASLSPTVVGTGYTLTEVATSTTQLGQYVSTISCSDPMGFQSNLPNQLAFDPAVGYPITPTAGAQLSCTITNTPKAPTLIVRQAISSNTSTQGPYTFNYSGSNGVSTQVSSTQLYPAVKDSGVITLNAANTSTSVTLARPAGWFYYWFQCFDANSAVTGNTGYLTAAQVNDTVTIPSQYVKAGAAFVCEVGLGQSSLSVSKALGSSRIDANNDQFTVQIKNGAGTVVASGTTQGSLDQISTGSGSTGVYGVTPNATYTLDEVMASGSSKLPQYSTSVSCTNVRAVASGGTDVSGIKTLGTPITPKDGDVISCVITNTAKAPVLKLQKQLGASGRIDPNDQFVLQVYVEGGGPVASATTTGSSNTPPNQAVATAVAGKRYMVGEAMATGSKSNVEQYSYPVSCTNALSVANGGFDVSGVTSQGALFGPLQAGDDITCTITNTAKPARLSLSKALGAGGRANGSDQFLLAIKTGGVNGTPQASVTTSGSNGTVTGTATLSPAAANTAYTLTEAGASGANLGQYTSTLTCTDSTGFQTGLPNGVAYDPNVGAVITPVAGANIGCVITNTPVLATLLISQSLSPTAHRYPIAVTYAANNGWSTRQLTSLNNDPVLSDVQSLTGTGVQMQFNLTLPNVFWRLQSVACTDSHAAITGNPGGNFGTVLSKTSFLIATTNVRPGAALSCAVLLFAPEPN